MSNKTIMISALLSLFIAPALHAAQPDEATMQMTNNGSIELPESASIEGQENSAFGLEAANTARDLGSDAANQVQGLVDQVSNDQQTSYGQ